MPLSLEGDAQRSDGMQVKTLMPRAKKATVLDKLPAA
jgi:hypothetical protein